MFRVARVYGQAPHAVAAWPFAVALLAFLHALESDRTVALEREAEAIRAATFSSYAFSEPERLADAHRELVERAGGFPDADTLRDDGAAVAARWAAGRELSVEIPGADSAAPGA